VASEGLLGAVNRHPDHKGGTWEEGEQLASFFPTDSLLIVPSSTSSRSQIDQCVGPKRQSNPLPKKSPCMLYLQSFVAIRFASLADDAQRLTQLPTTLPFPSMTDTLQRRGRQDQTVSPTEHRRSSTAMPPVAPKLLHHYRCTLCSKTSTPPWCTLGIDQRIVCPDCFRWT
jgi:hypothetical protein